MNTTIATVPLRGPLLRGGRRPRVVLVGRFGAGKSTLFEAAASPVVCHEHLAGLGGAYQECVVNVGLDEISLVDLPSIESLHRLSPQDQVVLMYLLWGDRWPSVAPRSAAEPATGFAAPDVLVQVVDATMLEKDLELSLELSLLGRPMVIALNRVDEARRKGLYINVQTLSERLGVPVVPTVAHMGKGITALFETIVDVAREKSCPLPQPPARHITASLQSLHDGSVATYIPELAKADPESFGICLVTIDGFVYAAGDAELGDGNLHPGCAKLVEHQPDHVFTEGFQQIEVPLGEFGANARDHHRVVDGLGDVVVARRLVGNAEGEIDFQRLRRGLLPVVDADMGIDAHSFDEDEIHPWLSARIVTILGEHG